MITLNELNLIWNKMNLTQQLVILRILSIESISFYHLSKDRYIRLFINQCKEIRFHQLTSKHQKRVLDYANKLPDKFKIEESTNEIQAEFDLEIDKKAKIFD